MARLLTVVLAVAVCAALAPRASAQEIADVMMTPREATVGDRLTLTITVRHASDVELAPLQPEVFSPLDVLEARPAETRDLSGGQRETTLVFVLAAFLTGDVRLPEIELRTASGRVVATGEAPPIAIESVLPGQVTELRDISDPLQAATGPPSWVWAALLMAGFVALTIFTMALARIPAGEPPPPVDQPARAEPAEEAAYRELDAIAAAALLDRGGAVEYYRRIAVCLRGYISRRYEIAAGALTPRELAEELEGAGADRLAARLAVNTLEQCEAVQFAGYEPVRERAEADLAAAREVVSLTTAASEAPAEQEAPARR